MNQIIFNLKNKITWMSTKLREINEGPDILCWIEAMTAVHCLLEHAMQNPLLMNKRAVSSRAKNYGLTNNNFINRATRSSVTLGKRVNSVSDQRKTRRGIVTDMMTNDSLDEPQKKIPRVDGKLQTQQPVLVTIDANVGLPKFKSEPLITNVRDQICRTVSKIHETLIWKKTS